ncbi:hypothetical protein QCM77_45420 [Bradyrhizobium sp. SSUT18]|uniref:hypothetical protein n=1 Tax=Bradyrhizobium sp. SSUT18 TaxID=3040602 RepID=UPI002447BBFA|nr:hypothetical protein [Bradyrhizobium sp. SSUT18]MDH2407008.1 hypothetical protein [Bradyrhizobium sp. SSUT18]
MFAICSLLIAVLALCLGFFALLRQHTYLDLKTSAPVDIELPILGRMKANYPALVFPFIAAFFGQLAYISRELPRTQWSVAGTVGYADGNPLNSADWNGLQIKVLPDRYNTTVSKDNAGGRFKITPALLDGYNFEDEIISVIFSLSKDTEYLSCQFSPKQEFDNWSDQSKRAHSLLQNAAQHSRMLKGVKLNKYNAGDAPC